MLYAFLMCCFCFFYLCKWAE